MRPSKRAKLLDRRRTARINFYDLALVSTGAAPTQYTELDYGPLVPAFAPEADYGSPTSGASAYDSLSNTDYEGLLDKLFEVPVGEWSNHYKKITPAMDYDLGISKYTGPFTGPLDTQTLSNGNADFTDAGWKAPADYLEEGAVMHIASTFGGTVHSECVTPPFFLAGGSEYGNKVTTEFDIDAPEAAFTPSRKMDIFLMPALNFTGAWARVTSGSGAALQDQHLNDFWTIYPRGAFLDSGHDLYPLTQAYGKYYAGFNFLNSERPPEGVLHASTPYGTGVFQAGVIFAEWMKTLPGARGQYRTAIGGSGGFTDFDAGEYFNTGIPGTPDDTVNYYSSYMVPANANLLLLRAVVRQGVRTYYFWNSGWA